MNAFHRLLSLVLALTALLAACGKKVVMPGSGAGPVTTAPVAGTTTVPLPDTLFLPENLVARDPASGLTARYTDPTTRYAHGILGDRIEAGGLLVVSGGKGYPYRLSDEFVFEDLQPRLADLDNDGQPEIVTILTSLTRGASVAVFKLANGKLIQLAGSNFVGNPNRWLNLAAIADLDNDGRIEIAWVQTPHIGGILRVARVAGDRLEVIDERSGYSNHRIGQRNLCLSVVAATQPVKTLYLPLNDYSAVAGLQLRDGKLTEISRVSQPVDGTKPLIDQFQTDLALPDASCVLVR